MGKTIDEKAVPWYEQPGFGAMPVAARVDESGQRHVMAKIKGEWVPVDCTDAEWDTIIKPHMEELQCQPSLS